METKKLLMYGALIIVIYVVYNWYKAKKTAKPTEQLYYADGTPVIPGVTKDQNEGN